MPVASAAAPTLPVTSDSPNPEKNEKKPLLEVRGRRLSRIEKKRPEKPRRYSTAEMRSPLERVGTLEAEPVKPDPEKQRKPLDLVLAVTKSDTMQCSPSKEFRTAIAEFSREFNLRVTYVSVKNGDEVRELFRYGAMHSLHTRFLENPEPPPAPSGTTAQNPQNAVPNGQAQQDKNCLIM